MPELKIFYLKVISHGLTKQHELHAWLWDEYLHEVMGWNYGIELFKENEVVESFPVLQVSADS